MAGSDYERCGLCEGKAFYAGETDTGDCVTFHAECAAKIRVTFDAVADALLRHQARPLNSPNCMCGWRPTLSLNDTEADRGQHLGHVAQVIVGESR